MNMKRIIVDCSTGESQEVDLTPEEIAELELKRIAFEEEQAQREAEAAARAAAKEAAAAKLAALGLTEEEIAAITA